MKKPLKIKISAISVVALFCLLLCNNGYTQNQVITGTEVPVKLVTTLESDEDNYNPMACVSSDVHNSNGELIIKAGTQVLIKVDKGRSRGMGHPGYIEVVVINTFDITGYPVYLSGKLYEKGERHTGKAIGLGLGLGLTILCPFGLFFFCIHGDDVTFPAGTVIPGVFAQ
jgi:hypothetical protein